MAKGSSKKKKARMKPEVVPQIRNSLEWLPHGWTLQIKTQSSGERVGRKYKCYFDPLSGSRFFSKAGVLRFLKSGNVYTPTTREERCFKACTTDNVLAQIEYSPHGLPPGWIKELKFRKSNYKGIKADPYYTDPLSGYVFRSLKDAMHYVETGKISKRAFRPSKSVHDKYSLDKESPRPIPVKKLKSLRSNARRRLFTGSASTSNGEVTVEIDASPDKLLLPLPDHASSESFQNVDLTSSPSIEPSEGKADKKRKKELKNQERKAKVASLPKTRFRSEKEKKRSEEMQEPCRVIVTAPSVSQEKQQQQRAIKHKLVTSPLRRSSRRLAGLDPAPITDLVIHQPSRRSMSNGRRNGIKESVLLAEPGRMSGEEKSLGEKLLFEGQTLEALPFSEIWQDPCIEFAVKTLLGEIPVPDEGIAIEKYVQKQLGSSVETEKLNPGASAVADSDMTRSIGLAELRPEKKQLPGPARDESKACPSEKVMQKFNRLGL